MSGWLNVVGEHGCTASWAGARIAACRGRACDTLDSSGSGANGSVSPKRHDVERWVTGGTCCSMLRRLALNGELRLRRWGAAPMGRCGICPPHDVVDSTETESVLAHVTDLAAGLAGMSYVWNSVETAAAWFIC